MKEPLVEIDDLHVQFQTPYGNIQATSGVSFNIYPGETLAVVGESGSGKTVTGLEIMGLLPRENRTSKGRILFEGHDLLKISQKEYRRIRGGTIGMIFQDPMTSLNPTMKIGKQIAEGIRRQRRASRKAAKRITLDMLERVGIPRPEKRFNQYPHEFSGGMRQRAMIAMALACKPKLLIADEPTTALDVTIEAQILDLLRDLQKETGTSILLITHDLGVVAGMADRVVVMYAGRVAEAGSVESVFENPSHPYTHGLLQSVPQPHTQGPLISIPGSPPSLSKPIIGCPFADRCPYAMKVCKETGPCMVHHNDDHKSACWLHDPRAAKQFAKYARKEA